MKKIIRIFLITILLLLYISNDVMVCADTSGSKTEKNPRTEWKDAFSYADKFTDGNIEWDSDNNEKLPSISDMENNIKKNANGIFNFLLAIGTALTVIVGAVLGIQYMMASAEDKAKVKEKMIPYIVGCIVIYGAFTIWYIVVEVLGKMS